ncbi:MAG TPA: hypothetical protein VJK51_03330 [Candidatus Nanoarchaeia archaeon]|nr:hypothetical protein [Candidatus Nanoarchaeia archaeon]
MNLKLVFGIIVPVIFIIVITLIANSNASFKASTNYVNTIELKDVYAEGKLRNYVKIGEIMLENGNILGKRYKLESITACLRDLDGTKEPMQIGQVQYSEGDYNPSGGIDEFIYDSNSRDRSVQVNANEEKTVTIFIQPNYNYYQDYNQLRTQYQDYDQVVLIENKNSYNSYNDCYNLQTNQDTILKTIKLNI